MRLKFIFFYYYMIVKRDITLVQLGVKKHDFFHTVAAVIASDYFRVEFIRICDSMTLHYF